jgi:hypothetical protein
MHVGPLERKGPRVHPSRKAVGGGGRGAQGAWFLMWFQFEGPQKMCTSVGVTTTYEARGQAHGEPRGASPNPTMTVRGYHEVVELIVHRERGGDGQVMARGPHDEVVDGRAHAIEIPAVDACHRAQGGGSGMGGSPVNSGPLGRTWDDHDSIQATAHADVLHGAETIASLPIREGSVTQGERRGGRTQDLTDAGLYTTSVWPVCDASCTRAR